MLKRFFFYIALAVFFSQSISGVLLAQDYSQQERVDNFSATFKINTDSTIDVTETITYNTGNIYRHGIYRDILLKNSFEGMVKLSNLSVISDNDVPYQYQRSNLGNSVTRIKIGDPNVTFNGERKYIVKYQLVNTIGFAEEWDELYWNVIGDQWQIPIMNVEALVALPEQQRSNPTYCYQGYGSKDQCPISHLHSLDNLSVDANDYSVLEYKSNRTLHPGEFFTVIAGLPKNIIIQPTWIQKIIMLMDWTYLFLILPVLALIIMLRQWYKYGRDPKSNRTIIAQYDVPDGLTPMEVSAILKEKVDGRSISAEIIYWATKGYLKIERIEKKGLFVKTYDLSLIHI